ncbi:hypothetical protein KBZ94_38265 [Streptomyces sp. RM72]|uniref:hypothetical protein n=1 Tax=Streptomyces sp. RM72 TaxID=1115510 RepID=UPI001B397B61|nr:hypothetical protein [Streptomyces sp. RM72]MBQ0890699.1 hypothetical protein [Streptomyces sp. RM72]
MAIPRHIPPRRTVGAARRIRPAPLSPQPEWRAQYLFVEPRYAGLTPSADDDADEELPAPAEPPVFRSRRRPYRP